MSETDARKSASQLLVEAREQTGLSQKDVADQLFLSAKIVVYIDNEEFDKFPKSAFIKGYLRSYARVVGLSGEEIVARYEEELSALRAEEEESKVEEKTEAPDSNQKIVRAGMFGIGAFVIVVILVWLMSAGKEEDQVEVIEEPMVMDIESVDREPVVSDQILDEQKSANLDGIPGIIVATESESNVIDADSLKEAEVVEEGQGEAKAETEEIEQSRVVESEAEIAPVEIEVPTDAERMRVLKEVALQRTRERDVQYIIVRAGGDDELKIEFDDECWVEIKDGEGDLIYAELNRKGDVLKVYGLKPFDILFGKADAVSLQFNGETVNFDSKIQNDDTARVQLDG